MGRSKESRELFFLKIKELVNVVGFNEFNPGDWLLIQDSFILNNLGYINRDSFRSVLFIFRRKYPEYLETKRRGIYCFTKALKLLLEDSSITIFPPSSSKKKVRKSEPTGESKVPITNTPIKSGADLSTRNISKLKEFTGLVEDMEEADQQLSFLRHRMISMRNRAEELAKESCSEADDKKNHKLRASLTRACAQDDFEAVAEIAKQLDEEKAFAIFNIAPIWKNFKEQLIKDIGISINKARLLQRAKNMFLQGFSTDCIIADLRKRIKEEENRANSQPKRTRAVL